jgi:hypothetical protein
VVPGLETEEDWQEHRAAILVHYSPEGALQFELAERVALLTWRLRRVARYETQSVAISQEKVEDDFHSFERLMAITRGEGLATTHPEDFRVRAAHAKRAERAFERFPSQEPGKVLKAEDAGAIVFGVYLAAKKTLGGELEAEELDLPGIADDDDICDLPAMKVGDVRGCIEVLAAAASVEPEELLGMAAYEARYEARKAAHAKEAMERDLSRMQRERILPDAGTLQKIARYEAHLSRQLYQAMHALEILRAK